MEFGLKCLCGSEKAMHCSFASEYLHSENSRCLVIRAMRVWAIIEDNAY